MATKNISKSALEGGRYSHNKWDRRQSHNEERAAARDYCKRVAIDPEYADEDFIEDIRPVGMGFTDKLNPMERWLEKQVGRSWSEVRSEVAQKFDTRTTAGRHITYDHLLREVVDTESGFDKWGFMMNPNVELASSKNKRYRRGGYSKYYVDENDILCENDNYFTRYHYEFVNENDYKLAGTFLNGRMVLEKEGKLWWSIPMEGIWKASWFAENKSNDPYKIGKLKYYLLDNGPFEITNYVSLDNYGEKVLHWTGMSHGEHWEPIENPFSFRQRGELNAEEIKVFKELKEKLCKDILAFSKGR